MVRGGGLSHILLLLVLATAFAAAGALAVELNLAMLFRNVFLGIVISRAALAPGKQDGIAGMPKVARVSIPASPRVEVIAQSLGDLGLGLGLRTPG